MMKQYTFHLTHREYDYWRALCFATARTTSRKKEKAAWTLLALLTLVTKSTPDHGLHLSEIRARHKAEAAWTYRRIYVRPNKRQIGETAADGLSVVLGTGAGGARSEGHSRPRTHPWDVTSTVSVSRLHDEIVAADYETRRLCYPSNRTDIVRRGLRLMARIQRGIHRGKIPWDGALHLEPIDTTTHSYRSTNTTCTVKKNGINRTSHIAKRAQSDNVPDMPKQINIQVTPELAISLEKVLTLRCYRAGVTPRVVVMAALVKGLPDVTEQDLLEAAEKRWQRQRQRAPKRPPTRAVPTRKAKASPQTEPAPPPESEPNVDVEIPPPGTVIPNPFDLEE